MNTINSPLHERRQRLTALIGHIGWSFGCVCWCLRFEVYSLHPPSLRGSEAWQRVQSEQAHPFSLNNNYLCCKNTRLEWPFYKIHIWSYEREQNDYWRDSHAFLALMTQMIVWNHKITSRWSCCVVIYWEYMEM